MSNRHHKRTEEEIQELLKFYETHSECETLTKYHMGGPKFLEILNQYGVERRSAEENKKLTCLHRFGTEFAAKSEQVKQHQKETCLEKYGVENIFQRTDIIQEACKNKLGVDNPMKCESVVNKIKENWKDRTPEETDKSTEKRKNTCKQKYGVDHVMHNPATQAKLQQTMLERYGVKHNMQSKDIQEKMIAKNLETKGVMYNCQLPQCRNSYHKNSSENTRFGEFLKFNNIDYTSEFNIERYSYDFKVDNILIEIDPAATHNSTWSIWNGPTMDPEYHQKKSKVAEEHSYRCIHVFDWDDKQKVVNLLKSRTTIGARKCKVKEITKDVAYKFINQYHLQGSAKAAYFIGLFYNEDLVSVMTFGKSRYDKKIDYELIRYCSKFNVTGGVEKLFQYFIKTKHPDSIVSYCDRSKFLGTTYEKLGFQYISTSIGKHWYNMKTQKHITDNLLRQRGYDQLFGTNYGKGSSNDELMKQNGFVEIYDAGQAKYVWKF